MSTYWEWYFIAIIALWTILFPAGGTELPATKKGYKALRRYVAPALTVPLLLLLGIAWWRVAVACSLLCGFMHLGYGNGKSWWYRAVIGVLYALPSLVIGFTWWAVILPIGFIGLFVASNLDKGEKDFPWVLVCAMYGAMIAATLCGAVMKHW
jgi:hypothetical protein